MSQKPNPAFLRAAHGAAAKGGAKYVVETPPMDEIHPDPDRTVAGLERAAKRGRPFEAGNKAASGRGPSLERVSSPKDAPEENRRINRKAASLASKERRRLEVQTGGELPASAILEIKHWAMACSWAAHLYDQGKAIDASRMAEKASAHSKSAVAHAEMHAKLRDAVHGKTNKYRVDTSDEELEQFQRDIEENLKDDPSPEADPAKDTTKH